MYNVNNTKNTDHDYVTQIPPAERRAVPGRDVRARRRHRCRVQAVGLADRGLDAARRFVGRYRRTRCRHDR